MCYNIIQPFKTPRKTSFFFSPNFFLAAHQIASALILLPSASRAGKELNRNTHTPPPPKKKSQKKRKSHPKSPLRPRDVTAPLTPGPAPAARRGSPAPGRAPGQGRVKRTFCTSPARRGRGLRGRGGRGKPAG